MASSEKFTKGALLNEQVVKMVLDELEEPHYKQKPYWQWVQNNQQEAAWNLVINWVKDLDDYNPYGPRAPYKLEWNSIEWKEKKDIYYTLSCHIKMQDLLVEEVLVKQKDKVDLPTPIMMDIDTVKKENKKIEECPKIQIQPIVTPPIQPKGLEIAREMRWQPRTIPKPIMVIHKEKEQDSDTEMEEEGTEVKEMVEKLKLLKHPKEKEIHQVQEKLKEVVEIDPIIKQEAKGRTYYIVEGYNIEGEISARLDNKPTFSVTVGEAYEVFELDFEHKSLIPFKCATEQHNHKFIVNVKGLLSPIYCRGRCCSTNAKKPVPLVILIRELAIVTSFRSRKLHVGGSEVKVRLPTGKMQIEGNAYKLESYPLEKNTYETSLKVVSSFTPFLQANCRTHSLRMKYWQENHNKVLENDLTSTRARAEYRWQEISAGFEHIKLNEIWDLGGGDGAISRHFASKLGNANARVFEKNTINPKRKVGLTMLMCYDSLHHMELSKYLEFMRYSPEYVLIREHSEDADPNFLTWHHYAYGDRGPFYFRPLSSYMLTRYKWTKMDIAHKPEFKTCILVGELIAGT